MDPAQATGIAIGLGALGLLLLATFLKSNIVICQPNEIVILSGRKRRLADGTAIGYRILRGGRGFKWPFLESVSRLPLTAQPIELHLKNVLSSGMIPLAIEGRANVKLNGRPEEGLDAAIERFLGKGPEAIVRTAQQTIEGALRGVVATMDPQQANTRRLDLADQVVGRARTELARLGIVLDFVQVQDISDEHGYLVAIGRRQNAAVRRDALIAEATADAEARTVAAEQKRLGREAEIAAEMVIAERESALAGHRAALDADTNRAQERAKVAGVIARVQEEIELEGKRAERAERREQAETIIPARAKSEAMALEAQGRAARILEDGRSTAQAVELMRKEWEDGASRDLFLIRMLPELLDKVTRVVGDNLRIDRLTVLDGGNGDGLPNYVRNLTSSAITLLEQVKGVTGLDLAKPVEGKAPGAIPKELKN